MDLSKNRVNSINKSNSNGLSLSNAKVNDMGKSSLELSDNKLIIKSIESNSVIDKSLDGLDYLIYSKGNFIANDKIFMGISNEQFEISCTDDELEFKNFYDNIKQIKENGQFTDNSKLQTDTSNKSLSDNYVSKFISKKEKKTDETETNVEESNINVSEEIRNFYNLMKEGIITEEEFEEKKKELLKL